MADQVPPQGNPPFQAIYNPSGFTGQVTSDWMRLGGIPEALKKDLIDFSTADFDDFKAKFLEYIKSVYPADYTNFVESDLGMMLSELFAYMAGVLSFKADAIAQENYLVTARRPESILKLLELIGVTLHGPVSSKANAKVEITEEGDILQGSTTVTINKANRTVSTTSTKDNLPLTYTLYKVQSNGNIDMNSDSLVLQQSETTNLDGKTWENLVLLEGTLQEVTGQFPAATVGPEISIDLPSVVEGSVIVSASDGMYTEVENIWFASGGERVFQKIYNDDFSCRLKFGTGVAGRTPPPNTAYTVLFRTGGGLRGNVPQSYLNSTKTGFSNVVKSDVSLTLSQPRAGTGGQDAQDVADAKRWGPMWFATQYRAVTGQDYTTFVNTFKSTLGKTGKGLAVLRDNGSAGNMIDVYVLQKSTADHLERASFEFKKELLDYLNKYRMLTDEVTVVDGVVRTLDLVTTLYLDNSRKLSAEPVKEAVSTKISDYFSTLNMDFGTPFKLSDLITFVLQVPGVRYFSVDNYTNDVYADYNEIIQLNNFEVTVNFV